MTDIKAVQTEIKAVKVVLESFARFVDEKLRSDFLRAQMDDVEQLDTYCKFPIEALQEVLCKLKETENLLLARQVPAGDLQSTLTTAVAEEQSRKRKRDEEVESVMQWMKQAKLNGDALEFPPDCTLPPEYGKQKSGHNVMYVRNICWHLLWVFQYVTNVLCGEGILVVGPPGCGKTWCSQFFLWYFIVKDPQDVVFESVPSKRVWVFRKNGTVASVEYPANGLSVPELNDSNTVYIIDTAAGGQFVMCDCAAKKVMWSSANSANYKGAERVLTRQVFVTPNKLELQRACELFGRGAGSEREVNVDWYFNHSGGALRPPFCLDQDETEDVLVEASTLVNIDNIVTIVHGAVDANTVHGMSTPTSLFTTVVSAEHLPSLPEAKEDSAYETCRPASNAELEALRRAYSRRSVQWRICSEFVCDQLKKNNGGKI